MARVEKFRDRLFPKWRDALVGTELATRIDKAHEELLSVISAAKAILEKNPLTAPAAAAVAKELGKAGEASITVDENGYFWIDVDVRARGGDKRGWSTNLPNLTELRTEAESLGVDTKPLGRNKTMILKAIDNAKKNAAEQAASKLPEGTPHRRMTKTGPSVQSPVVITHPSPGNGEPPLKN